MDRRKTYAPKGTTLDHIVAQLPTGVFYFFLAALILSSTSAFAYVHPRLVCVATRLQIGAPRVKRAERPARPKAPFSSISSVPDNSWCYIHLHELIYAMRA